MRLNTLAFLLPAFLVLGCPPAEDKGDSATTDGDADTDTDADGDADADTDTDTDTDVPVPATLAFGDYLGGEPVEGATVTMGASTGTTDAGGAVTVQVPAEGNFWIDVTHPDYPAHHVDLYGKAGGFSAGLGMISNAAILAVGYTFGVTADPAKGLLAVAVVDGRDGTGLDGTTVTLDVASDVSVVKGDAGIGPGPMIPVGGNAVVFGNVIAGPVNITLATPAMETCVNFAGGTTFDGATESFAGGVSLVTFVCM